MKIELFLKEGCATATAVSGCGNSESETCQTKDTPSFGFKNRGAVFYIPYLGWLICLFKGHAKERISVSEWKCKRCHAEFGLPRFKGHIPPPPKKALVDIMSKVIDDKYLFYVKSGILSQEEYNDFKTEKIYFDLKAHFASSTRQ